ncbi:PREDICTED: rho guanine nucleotide exchange factor 40-like [Nanorana parkeri]|uniref:rho guanine nucleotide exchange factor 40-like n=1 Tax=Nanorana parkeri TaxID=125878 RepID=UPI000853FF22|nr:PREDICTED: rho guanine nucleotide exchange factor 40-like [Nanorana parkeri]
MRSTEENSAEVEESTSLVDKEPDPSPFQKPLAQPPLILDYKCLHKNVNWDILESEVFCLTGGQDQDNRALLIMSPSKAPSGLSQKDLQETIVYFYSLLRSDVRDLGMTLILDLRDCTANMEAFLEMLHNSKDTVHGCINRTLFVYDAENAATVQSDLQQTQVVLVSELAKYVGAEELPENLGGEKPYEHAECVRSQRFSSSHGVLKLNAWFQMPSSHCVLNLNALFQLPSSHCVLNLDAWFKLSSSHCVLKPNAWFELSSSQCVLKLNAWLQLSSSHCVLKLNA